MHSLCIDNAYAGKSTPTTAFAETIWYFAYTHCRQTEHSHEEAYMP